MVQSFSLLQRTSRRLAFTFLLLSRLDDCCCAPEAIETPSPDNSVPEATPPQPDKTCVARRPDLSAGRLDGCVGLNAAVCPKETAVGNAGNTVTPRNCVLGSNLAACGEWVKWTRSSSSAQLRSSDPLVWKPRYCSLQRHSGVLLSKAYYNLPREGGLRDDNFTSPLCAVLRELGVRRFLILGDSLSFVQVQNLFIGPSGIGVTNLRNRPQQFCVGQGPWRARVCESDGGRRRRTLSCPRCFIDPRALRPSCRGKSPPCKADGTPDTEWLYPSSSDATKHAAITLEFVRADCLSTPGTRSWLRSQGSSNHGECLHEGLTPGRCRDLIAPPDRWHQLLKPTAGLGPPDIVLINAGAHFHNRTIYAETLRRAAETIKRSAFYTHKRRPNGGREEAGIIVVRNTVEGHPNFEAAKGPLTPRAFTAQHKKLMVGKFKEWYGEFAAFNELLEGDLFLGSLKNAFLLDVDTATRLRPDGHSDYLHYPASHSAVWHWNDLLLTLLTEIAESEDARRDDGEGDEILTT